MRVNGLFMYVGVRSQVCGDWRLNSQKCTVKDEIQYAKYHIIHTTRNR